MLFLPPARPVVLPKDPPTLGTHFEICSFMNYENTSILQRIKNSSQELIGGGGNTRSYKNFFSLKNCHCKLKYKEVICQAKQQQQTNKNKQIKPLVQQYGTVVPDPASLSNRWICLFMGLWTISICVQWNIMWAYHTTGKQSVCPSAELTGLLSILIMNTVNPSFPSFVFRWDVQAKNTEAD